MYVLISAVALFSVPARAADTPRVVVDFASGQHTYDYDITIVTTGGKTRSVPATVTRQDAKEWREVHHDYLDEDGWTVEKVGEMGIAIRGLRGKNGAVDSVKSVIVTISNRGKDTALPTLTPYNGAQSKVVTK